MTKPPSIRIRWHHGDDIALGPGKADLLVAIRDTGSISAAGRHLGMSYRRAWLLVDAMNRCFDPPLVVSTTGGSAGGGARLTEAGVAVLALFREAEAQCSAVVAATDARLRPHFRRDA